MVKTFLQKCFADWLNCPIMHILPILLDMEARNGEHQITPSNFMREMLLSTEQRYEKLVHPAGDQFAIRNNLKSFKVTPDIIVFQNFVRGTVYSVQLSVMNIQDTSKSLRIHMEPSTYFSIKHSTESAGAKVAPGLKYFVEVSFSTDILQDYRHKITFITTDETFEVPIVAIGPRPLLDLPDKIVFPKTGIKITAERTIIVKNIGEVWASFVLETSCGFEVEENRKILKSDECCPITLFYHPQKIGLLEGELKLTYETGEILYVKLEGTAEEADLNISTQKVGFTDCYLGLSIEQVVTLRNNSEYIIDYRWITHDCPACKKRARSAIKERFEDLMDYELTRDNALEYHEIVDYEMNQEIYERILIEQKKECDMSLEPVYSDEHFLIEPKSGQLWPKTQVNFSIIYAPKNVELHKSIAYLDVTGRKHCFHLDMFGAGEGPRVIINLEELDAQNIYIGSVHRYEVIFHNLGPIDATLQYVVVDAKFGGDFYCSEFEFVIKPEEIKSVYIGFRSFKRGNFTETVKFNILESLEVLSFLMKGTIVCPLLNFDITVLDFGDLSVGQTKEICFYLENNTQVSIDYEIEIVATREYSQYTISDDLSTAEFSCSSTEGTVKPYSRIPYSVQATPHAAVDKMAELTISMWGARQPSRTAYIYYKVHVPLIQCLTPKISLKSMFITQKYYRTLTLENKSDFMGNLTLNTINAGGNLQMGLEKYQCDIQPGETFDFRLEIKTDVIGDMCGQITGLFYGSNIPFVICDVVALSRGPCIDSDLIDTNIGKVKTLTKITKPFKLSNDSPIQAVVYINISGPNITPAHNVIQLNPEETVVSELIIYGTNAGRFKTLIKLEIDGTEPDCVVYTGEFIGSSISTSPPVVPFYDIGAISTMTNCIKEVQFLNEGKSAHIISFKEYDTLVEQLTSSPVDNGRPYFIMTLNQFVLEAGKTQTVYFDCFAKSPCKITTRFICYAKRINKRNIITKAIFEFKLKATFEVPHVTLSKPYMQFRIDIGTEETTAVLEDDIVLTNNANVPLFMDIIMDEPFYFVSGDKMFSRQEVSLQPNEDMTFMVTFKSDSNEKKSSLKKGAMKIQYMYHPNIDKLHLFGVINYPNVAFEPNFVDLECIPIGHTGSRLINLRNISPLPVDYKFEIREDNLTLIPIEYEPKEIQSIISISSYNSLLDYMEAEEAIMNQFAEEQEIMGENSLPEIFDEQTPVKEEEVEQKEDDLSRPQSNDSSLILPNEDCMELAKQTFDDATMQQQLRPILYPLIDDFKDQIRTIDPRIVDIFKAYTQAEFSHRIIDVVPWSGTLAAYESQVISIAVTLPPKIEMAATVVCNVNGGASTDLDIFAKSGEIMYHIKSNVVDFGLVAFNQIAKTSFRVENIGYAKFTYSVRYDILNFSFKADPGWVYIDPPSGSVGEEGSAEVFVKYFPGYPGYFETSAYLEIASCDPIKLIIKGCAVLPQYYFKFPRLLNEEQNMLSYTAIADITYSFHSQCNEDFTMQIMPDYNDWVFVRYKRHYPSAKDIAMAVERKIIQQHLIANPKLVQYKYENTTSIIPDLVLPPYIIDLGYVILNTEQEVMITPLKYSEAIVKLFWLRVSRKCSGNCFSMVFQKNQPGPFLVFKPTSKRFPEPNSEVVGHISCIVSGTIRIDFEVRAIVTVPSLVFKHNSVDFGKVQCGFALKKTVFLENNGAVPCSYKILIQSSSERPANIFFTKARDGIVDAGRFAKIDMFFQPQSRTKYEWRLIVYIEANKSPLKIILRGYGFLPELEIIDDKIYFEPTIPYSITNVKYFKIINRSQFPVEICFTDVDTKLKEEAVIIKTLLNYYNVKKLFIPPRHVGAPLPPSLVETYEDIKEQLKVILKTKIKHEYMNMMKKSSVEDRSASLLIESAGSSESIEIPDPLEDISMDEMQTLVAENIYELRSKEFSTVNVPRRGSLFEIECVEPVEVEENNVMKEGVLIIFHGSSLTDYTLTANKTAHALKIDAKGIDQLIYESLVRNEILAANKVNLLIDESFTHNATEEDLNFPYDFDMFEIIKSKVNVIDLVKQTNLSTSRKETVIKTKDNKSTKSKKSAGKDEGTSTSAKSTKSPNKQKVPNDTFMQLPVELLYELLADSISKYPTGLIIENLDSLFITNKILALIGLFKGAGNIRYMHGIYLSVPPEYFRVKKSEMQINCGETSQNVSELMNEIIEMDQEEFDELNPNDLKLFKDIYLNQRVKETQQRLEKRKRRILNEKTKLFSRQQFEGSKVSTKGKKHITSASVKSYKSKGSKNTVKKQNKKSDDKQGSAQTDFLEESLIQENSEAAEIRYIFENWNRAENKISEPSVPKAQKKKDAKNKHKTKEISERSSTDSAKTRSSRDSAGYQKTKSRKRAVSTGSKKSEYSTEENNSLIKKKSIKFLTPSEYQIRVECGIPLWYICNAQSESSTSYSNLIPQFLSENEEVLEALRLAYMASLGEFKESEQLYTVLCEPKIERSKSSPNRFVLYDCAGSSHVLLTPSNVSVTKSLGGKSGSFVKSSTSILSSRKSRKTKFKSASVSAAKSLRPRRIMQPDDEISLEVNFFPDSCGVFTHFYDIAVVTLPIPFRVYLEGKADIPRLFMDPSMIFPKILPEKEGHDLGVAYFEKEEVFHLGAVAVQPADTRIQCLIVEDKLNLINKSYLSCDVSVGFLEVTSNFTLDTSQLSIASNNSQFLTIRGHPVNAGSITANLLITKRNNPRVDCFKISELGTHFNVEISPHDILFERVLLNRIVKIDVELRNMSHIGTSWDINFKHIVDKYGISVTSGYIKPLGINIVTFTYEAAEYKVVPVQEIDIKFYDKNRRCEVPILKDTMKLSAEVVEIGLEFDSDVVLGDIKIGQLFTFMYTFKNKSHFELQASFCPFEDPDISDEMNVIRNNTILDSKIAHIKPNEATIIPIRFQIDVPMEFRNVPIFTVVISDPHIKREVLRYNLRVTGKVFSSSYKLCPSNELVFAPQLVDTEVKKDIVLYNNGKYSFSFVVFNKNTKNSKKGSSKNQKQNNKEISAPNSARKSAASVDSANASKNSKKSIKSKKSKGSLKSSKLSGQVLKTSSSIMGKKTKQSSLKQGIFTITPSTGVVQPHTEVYIQFTCKTKTIGTYIEEVLFCISGVTGKYANGHAFTIQGTACVPEIDFTCLEYIFKEHLVIDSQEDSLCLDQMAASCIFVKSDNFFYFNNTCINQEVEAHLHIRNVGEIMAEISAAITSESSVFRVEPETVSIEAYTSERISVFFKPIALEKYEGSINFTVQQSTNKLNFSFYGEGALPIIEVVSPSTMSSINTYELDFKIVSLDSTATKNITLYNPGPLDSKIIMGVIDDPFMNIILKPTDCQTFPKVSDPNDFEEAFKSTALVLIKAQQTVDVQVFYTPKAEEKIDIFIKIFISHNPYDCFKIHVTGQGYKEDVIIESLESFLASDFAPKTSKSMKDKESSAYAPTLLCYNLNFDCAHINKPCKKYIKLKNISSEDTYKFVFTPTDNLNFIPTIGHLKPLSSKDIIVIFYSMEPIIFENKIQLCKLTKIRYFNEELDDLAWDERQQCTIWVPEDDTIDNRLAISSTHSFMSTKMIRKKEEPDYEEISDISLAIRLMLNVIVDYCTYSISETEIKFPTTTMFETSEIDVIVKNTSLVSLQVDWIIGISQYPKRSDKDTFNYNSAGCVTEPPKRPQTCNFGKTSQHLTGNEQFLKFTRPKSAVSRNSLFSTSFLSVMSSVHSYCDSDPIPLTIHPSHECIAPKTSCTFTFKFAPFTPLDYLFDVSSAVPNLHPDVQPISLKVYATSVLPLYHFRIEQSDYLSARRGTRVNCEMGLEENTKVLEFNVIGFGIPVKNNFSIINPTGEKFSYRWEKCIKERNIAHFQCDNPEGTVLKGRTAEASFTFIAEKAGTFEMFYYFTIMQYNLKVMFLLVGHAHQPCVYFIGTGKVLKPTVIGIDVHDTVVLKNTEDIPLTYRIIKSSLYSEGRVHKISIEPTHGLLHAKSDTDINVVFRPTKVGQFTFNVEFNIERMQNPLVLAITTTCYNIEPTLKHIKEYSSVDLLIDVENVIQMVLVQKHPEMSTFIIGNVGRVGFYYKWDLTDKFLEDFATVSIEPKEGYIKTNCEVQSVISITAVKFLSKKNIKLELNISYGPTIPITLVCTTCKTRLKFSDTMHDFGACLAQKHNTFSNVWTLELSNNDSIIYIVQIESQNYDHLTICTKDTIISPKQTIKILFYFHPKEIAKYTTKINILVNDKKYPITLHGEGVSMEVELCNICDKFLNFGAVPLGKHNKKGVQIINKTKCTVSIYFDLYHRLPIFMKTVRYLTPDFEQPEMKPSDMSIKKKKPAANKNKTENRKSNDGTIISKKSKSSKDGKHNKTMKSSKSNESVKKKDNKKAKKETINKQKKSVELIQTESMETQEEKQHRLIDSSIRIRPSKWIKLQPQNSTEFKITYMPTERMPAFQEQVYCQVEDTVFPLCVLKASCIAPEYSLLKSKISFGTLIIGSSNKYYTKLINSGDVGGRFKWSWKSARSEVFTIQPVEGYSSPGSCTNFEVSFHPSFVQCNCTSWAKLTIDNYKTVFDLELCGSCINLPSPKDTLKFSGPVRETYTKKFTLKNSTPEAWVIKPILSGEFFHIDDLIVVEAKSSSVVEVTYQPLAMTQGNKYHEGNIFLPLPEGQGMLYGLLGESKRPKTTQIIEKSIPSKTYNVIELDLLNWLKVTQQFTVINQTDQPEGPKKVLYKLTGTTIVDVPPCSTKTYKWIIYTLNEGKLNFSVKFRNETTKEYICYELKLTVVKCSVLDTITLNACARSSAEYKMRLENPLGEPTTYKMSSQCADLHFPKEATVPGYTEIEILIEYRPLQPTSEFSTTFEAVSPNLGTFPYSFILSAPTAEPEPLITIKCHLGQQNVHNAYVFNWSKTNAEVTATLDNSEFTVEKVAIIKPNERGPIEICFDPSDLGGVHSKLTLTSPTLGIYIFPLYGIGLPPKPQGPFKVKPNFQTNITFKNPFTTGMTFLYAVTGTDFILQSNSEFIKARSTTRINISCDKRDDSKEVPASFTSGKLSVTCADEAYSGIEWVIYLQSSNT